MREPGRSDAFWWWGLVGVAIVARLAAIGVLQSHHVPRSTYEHGEIAANLIAGQGFSIRFLGVDGPTSQQAPVYPVVLALAFAVAGVETPTSLLLVQLAQAGLGGLMVAGVIGLTRTLDPSARWGARLSGALAALHPTLIYAATHIQVALLAATLLVWILVLAARADRRSFLRKYALAGLLLGLLVLTDPILTIVVAAVGLFAWARLGAREGLLALGMASLVMMLTVSPWVVRNYRVHGEFVWVKSTFGYAFWQGNCSISEGTDKVVRPSIDTILARSDGTLAGWNKTLWDARHEAGYIDDIALTPSDRAELAKRTECQRSKWLMRRAMEDLQRDPWRYPTLCLRRLQYFLLFDETNPKTRSLLYRTSHAGLSILAVVGLAMAGQKRRKAMAPMIALFLMLTAFHSLTIISARFHIPIEPMFAVWAGVGVGRWLDGRIGRASTIHAFPATERLKRPLAA